MSKIEIRDNYDLSIKKIPGVFFLVCLLAAFYSLYEILTPFVNVLIVAAILATVFYPVYEKFRQMMPKSEKLASFITCFLVILIIVVPITVFAIMLTSEAYDTYAMIEQKVEAGDFDTYIEKYGEGKILNDIKEFMSPVIDFDTLDIKEKIIKFAQSVSTFLVEQTANLVKSFTTLLLNFLIMLFSMYYFFRDGKKLLTRLMHLSPLPRKYEIEILKKFQEVSKATLFGIFFTAIAQGIVGGIGFLIAGIDQALFWGASMALFSLVPVVGTAIIWVPAAILLLIFGNYFGGIFLLVWGGVVINAVDNILRPYLIEGKAKLYPLLTFLTIFGGLIVFGLKGIIFGPLILAICMTFLHIYELEYRNVLKH